MGIFTFEMQLRGLRADRLITQEEIANEIGVSVSLYKKWEQGKKQPSIDELIRLSIFFECTVDYLIGNDETDFGYDINKLSYEESQLLDIFNLLTDEQKYEVIGFAKATAKYLI